MFPRLMKQWTDLTHAKPGKRFQNRYEQRSRRRGNLCLKTLYVVLGTALLLVGIVMLPAPGPGFVLLFPGAAMIAEESLVAARAFDWAEIEVRALLSWMKRTWQRASAALRAAVFACGALFAGGVGWAAYVVLFQ